MKMENMRCAMWQLCNAVVITAKTALHLDRNISGIQWKVGKDPVSESINRRVGEVRYLLPTVQLLTYY